MCDFKLFECVLVFDHQQMVISYAHASYDMNTQYFRYDFVCLFADNLVAAFRMQNVTFASSALAGAFKIIADELFIWFEACATSKWKWPQSSYSIRLFLFIAHYFSFESVASKGEKSKKEQQFNEHFNFFLHLID